MRECVGAPGAQDVTTKPPNPPAGPARLQGAQFTLTTFVELIVSGVQKFTVLR